ncbi:MAG: DUF305 domain-containing protein [Pseudonocardiaceae bacterium]
MISVPTALTSTRRLGRWVAVVVLALGLVAMHHLVDPHATGLSGGPGGMTMPATPLGECCGPTQPAAGPAQPDPDAVPMLHLCLAVLTGLVLLAGWGLARCSPHCPGRARAPGAAVGEQSMWQRAPPTPCACPDSVSFDCDRPGHSVPTTRCPRPARHCVLTRARSTGLSEGDRSNMRINSATAVLAAAAVTGGLLAGCGTTSTSPAGAPPAASSTTGTGQQQHNQADITFLQGMIPHHAQAIAMAQLAPTKAASPQVKDLADRIQAEQGPEIAQMSGLLRSWGAPVPATTEGMTGMQPGHAGMPGMMSDQQMQQLTATSGAAFDRMFLQMMIAHHQGAVTMSQTELTRGSNPAARHLAQQIITGQQAEISQMQTLLQQR